MNAGAITVREATAEDVETARQLFREYAAWLGVDLGFQSFDEELTSLPGPYVRPHGFILLAETENRIVGCVALKALAEGVAEAKRLYVLEEYRSQGIGRRLMAALIAAAREIGYWAIRLDTLPQMTAARALYEMLGFRPIAPYYYNPIAGTAYMELVLDSRSG
jgi:putative acetyltransferase